MFLPFITLVFNHYHKTKLFVPIYPLQIRTNIDPYTSFLVYHESRLAGWIICHAFGKKQAGSNQSTAKNNNPKYSPSVNPLDSKYLKYPINTLLICDFFFLNVQW